MDNLQPYFQKKSTLNLTENDLIPFAELLDPVKTLTATAQKQNPSRNHEVDEMNARTMKIFKKLQNENQSRIKGKMKSQS